MYLGQGDTLLPPSLTCHAFMAFFRLAGRHTSGADMLYLPGIACSARLHFGEEKACLWEEDTIKKSDNMTFSLLPVSLCLPVLHVCGDVLCMPVVPVNLRHFTQRLATLPIYHFL